MFRNYFKIGIRNLVKNKFFTIINIFGLTIGLSCCFLIGLYLQNEFSFDKFQSKGHRIARVIMEYSFDGSPETKRGNYTSTKVAPVFTRTFPEVLAAVRMADYDRVIRNQDNFLLEHNFMYADSTFFDLFQNKIIIGDAHTALEGPNKVVLTKTSAKKYFGDDNPVGKILKIGTFEMPYEVTAVMQDYPENSQIKFDFLASFSSLGDSQEETYFEANYTTYLLLQGENSFETLQAKISPFMKKEMEGQGASINYSLERFDKIHLHSEYAAFVPNTNINYLYILAAVALLILLIVCFTYINLSTARSLERAKEVGVRKVIGAEKSQLFWQFIGESAMLCFAALLASVFVVMIVLPIFNDLANKHLQIKELFSSAFIILIISSGIILSLLAGLYPALILANFKPIKVLKGTFKNTSSGNWLQNSLIVFQFSISIFLIISTFLIQKQLYFIQHKSLGYDRDHVLVLRMNREMINNLSTLKDEFKVNPDIISISACNSTPVRIPGGYNMRAATMPENEQISVFANPVDEDYIKTTGLHIVSGKDFTLQDMVDVSDENNSSKIFHFILNESAIKLMGWTSENAIGKKMFLGGHREGIVSAVIKDFHFDSMHELIKPLVLFTQLRERTLLIKVTGHNLSNSISFLESKWKQIVPSMPFEYHFLDDDYNKLYISELQ
ncbi:MAG: ABC transporter permease, partial [Saprospiraceae bacterium]